MQTDNLEVLLASCGQAALVVPEALEGADLRQDVLVVVDVVQGAGVSLGLGLSVVGLHVHRGEAHFAVSRVVVGGY